MIEGRVVSPASKDDDVRARHTMNRASWNCTTAYYSRLLAQAAPRLGRGESVLHPIERTLLGPLDRCHLAVNLQCSIGLEAMSLRLAGVRRVIGVDISDQLLAIAATGAADLGIHNIEWINCDVLDVLDHIDEKADVVFSSQGAVRWIHDLDRWAIVISGLLRPGGRFVLFDAHPVSSLFRANGRRYEASYLNYFDHAQVTYGWPDDYVGQSSSESRPKFERLWTVSNIFMALCNAGLTVVRLEEYPDAFWEAFPSVPADMRLRLPLTLGIVAENSDVFDKSMCRDGDA